MFEIWWNHDKKERKKKVKKIKKNAERRGRKRKKEILFLLRFSSFWKSYISLSCFFLFRTPSFLSFFSFLYIFFSLSCVAVLRPFCFLAILLSCFLVYSQYLFFSSSHNLHTDPTSSDPRDQEKWQGTCLRTYSFFNDAFIILFTSPLFRVSLTVDYHCSYYLLIN